MLEQTPTLHKEGFVTTPPLLRKTQARSTSSHRGDFSWGAAPNPECKQVSCGFSSVRGVGRSPTLKIRALRNMLIGSTTRSMRRSGNGMRLRRRRQVGRCPCCFPHLPPSRPPCGRTDGSIPPILLNAIFSSRISPRGTRHSPHGIKHIQYSLYRRVRHCKANGMAQTSARNRHSFPFSSSGRRISSPSF